jgi:photosystem II stability/assembly factor-like uncharacterized protein
MPLLSSPASRDPASRKKPPKTPFLRIGHFPIFLIALVLIVLATFAWQAFYQQQTGMIVGRPLASPETHLHTVVWSPDPGVVYLGTHFGLFISTDGGHTWPQHQGDLNTTMVTSVAVSPTDPDLLAVLVIPTSGIGRQAGISVSADAGKDWRFTVPAGLPASAYPYSIQATAGAGGHFFVFFTGAGWFETHDLGQHWSSLTTGNLATIQNPSLLTDVRNPNHLLMGGDQGLFETENDGQNWQEVTAVPGSVLSLVATQPIGTHARVIICSTDQGLYRGLEQDGQIVWSPVHLSAAVSPTRLVMSADGSALYALSGSELWFSEDQGTSWVHRWHFTRGDISALELNPNNPRELLAGFFWPGLVLISMDQGNSWHTLTD